MPLPKTQPQQAIDHVKRIFLCYTSYPSVIIKISLSININNGLYKYFMINLTKLISIIDFDQYNRPTIKIGTYV